jgi:hypothetical protein
MSTPNPTPPAGSAPAKPVNPAVAAAAAAAAAAPPTPAPVVEDSGDDVLPNFPAELEDNAGGEGAAADTTAGDGGGDEIPVEDLLAQTEEAARQGEEGAEDVQATEGEGEGEQPAAEGEEAQPGEGEEPPAGEEAVETPPAAPPAPDPQELEAQRQREAAQAAAEAAYSQWSRDFEAVEAALEDKEFDPLDPQKGAQQALKVVSKGMKILRDGMQELGRQTAELNNARAVDQFWSDWGRKNPQIGAERGRAMYDEELGKAQSKYKGADARAVRLAASERWESRLTQIRAKSKTAPAAGKTPATPAKPAPATPAKTPATPATPPKPAAAKPPATPSGKPRPPVSKDGRAIPRGAATRPPAPKPQSEEEVYSQALREVGSVSAILGD